MKENLIDTPDFYLRLKSTSGRVDLYFNNKGNPNEMRGHVAIESGEGVHSTISIPRYFRNPTGDNCFLTVGENGIFFNFGDKKFRF